MLTSLIFAYYGYDCVLTDFFFIMLEATLQYETDVFVLIDGTPHNRSGI